jgi:tRNA-specific 2-thiouridylase
VSRNKRVVVAMSGGVDSSVAAALLVEQGYEVVGMMLRLWSDDSTDETAENRCCSLEAVDDARRVAAHLGIPFYLINAEHEFKSTVVDFFVGEYAAGRTPNPCLECNRHIRFGFLLERALALGAYYLATGHYARVRVIPLTPTFGSLSPNGRGGQGARGEYQLLKAVDPAKDQSYVLSVLGQRDLTYALFPLGELTKPQVRELARQRHLPVAEKAESQELCFLADGNYRGFLARHQPEALVPGPIVDQSGLVLGQHQGLPLYTIGQRKGLGIVRATTEGRPYYVLALDTARNALVVGEVEGLARRELNGRNVNWTAGEPPAGPIHAGVKIRYKAVEAAAEVTPLPGCRVRVIFDQPQRAVTPGQAVVFYAGEVCLGGGIIE